MSNGIRWGMITFLLGIVSGVLGHYLPPDASAFIIVTLSIFFALIGAGAISEK